MKYLEEDWCGLDWSEWYPLHEGRSLAKGLGKGPGIYRIRDPDKNTLAYIGQSGRCLRKNLEVLRDESSAKRVAPDSKHFASPCVFVYNKVKDVDVEVSTLSFKGNDPERLATECFLIWNYRHEAGSSPRCNLGKFHEGFEMTVDDDGVKVRKLDVSEESDYPSIAPLDHDEPFASEEWMGLRWTEWLPLDKKTVKAMDDEICFLRLADDGINELKRVDHTESLKETLAGHLKEKWSKKALFSISFRGLDLPPIHIAEIRNDLIAGYYLETSEAPTAQFIR